MMRNRGLSGLLVAAALLTCGCAGTMSGRATGPASRPGTASSGDGSAPVSGGPCADITISDPSIAFQPALTDDAELTVGQTGWIHSVVSAKDVDVTGDPGTVSLADRSLNTDVACGQARSSVSWIEVTAEQAGTVVLTIPGTASGPISLTVRR